MCTTTIQQILVDSAAPFQKVGDSGPEPHHSAATDYNYYVNACMS